VDKSVIIEHFNRLAAEYDVWLRRNEFYHRCVQSLYKSVIPAGSSVLEVGCASGELLQSVKPSCGVGIDISENMVSLARQKYPDLTFISADIDTLPPGELNMKFDRIILSNLVDYLSDIVGTLARVKEFINDYGLIILTTENPLWQPLMKLGSKLKLRMPDCPRNYVMLRDLKNIAELADFEVIKMGFEFLVPLRIPFLSSAINSIVAEIPFLRKMCLLQYIVMRHRKRRQPLSCSVIIPCHNEADNIAECIQSVPPMGTFTEIIVVDDGSTDDTKLKVEAIMKNDGRVRLISHEQRRGKGYAVRSGGEAAQADVIMILDADMSVPPEELPRFFEPIQAGRADFVNGTRMIYPMKGQAMRTLNYLGNKFFSLILSWLMEQHISDTLCGTKACLKKDYLKIRMGRCAWGDFDLLFGIARLRKKIVEMPVHYQERVAGKSKMRVLKHGLLLMRMCFVGLYELKLLRRRASA